MPLLRIATNHPLGADQRKQLLRMASAAVSEILNKPEGYVMVLLENNPDMLFAGEETPLAYLELKSIALPEDQTGALSESLCELVTRTTGIPGKRVYIEFANAKRHLWGWDRTTFER